MKRIISIILIALCMTMLLCSCKTATPEHPDTTSKPESSTHQETEQESVSGLKPENDTLSMIRSQMNDEGCGLAVAQLGYYEGESDGVLSYLNDSGILKEFPFLTEYNPAQMVRAGGGELYLVIPPVGKTVSVFNWVIDETNGFEGHVGGSCYYTGEDMPFLMTCNESDILPNAVILIDNTEIAYTPSSSLQDGTLAMPGVYEAGQGVLDITPDFIVTQATDNTQVFGKWTASSWDDDVNYTVYLVLDEEGVLFFSYTVENRQISYIGTWAQNANGDYVFDLSGDQMYGEWETTPTQTLQTTVHLVAMSEQLSMNYVSGDALWGNEQTFADSTYVFE